MKKKVVLIIIFIIAVILLVSILIISRKGKNEVTNTRYNPEDVTIALTLEDKIDKSNNAMWCGTFQLIWNDLRNDLAKQDIVFTPQPEVVENLNKGTFNTSKISDKSYYKIYGKPTFELKKQIESAIKEKFNETSDILDSFNWDNSGENDYFLYAMLKKEFEFPKVFTKFKNQKFGDNENVKCFGIDNSTKEQVREQVKILYYNSKKDFAIKLITKTEDEVIIAKGINGNSFMEIYEKINRNSENYKGSKTLLENENVKIPNLDFKIEKNIEEIEGKPFLFSDGREYQIDKALQTIQFSLDEKGGKIKSEAGMMIKEAAIQQPEEKREFIVDSAFCIFLKENDKDLPYFAGKISDITKFQ